jgi:hypothetical protein
MALGYVVLDKTGWSFFFSFVRSFVQRDVIVDNESAPYD